jgi:hypothetical protein
LYNAYVGNERTEGLCFDWCTLNYPAIVQRLNGFHGQVTANISSWTFTPMRRVLSFGAGGHFAIRIQINNDHGELVNVFYVDDMWLGGNDQVFYPDEIPDYYIGPKN